MAVENFNNNINVTKQNDLMRKRIFKEMQNNTTKSVINKIYNSIQGNQTTMDNIVNEDAVSPGNLAGKATQTVFNTKVASVADCIGAASEMEIADILDRFVDEMIVYGTGNNRFCEPDYSSIEQLDITDNAKQELKDEIDKAFSRVYRLLKYSRHNIRSVEDVSALAKRWLTIGKLAYFIVYDNLEKPTKILDIIPIDLRRYTLIKHDIPVKVNNGKYTSTKTVTYWTLHENTGNDQYGRTMYNSAMTNFTYSLDNAQFQKDIFTDMEITMADWSRVEFELSNVQSYTAMLLRPFNILRIMERTKIIWAVMNSRYRTMYKIPVANLGKQRGKQVISMVMNDYKENVEFNSTTGQISVNGQPDLPFNKDIWMGRGNAGEPEIIPLGGNGPDMSDTSTLTPFYQKLQKASKMPMSRFEENNAVYWDINPMAISLEERRFGKYNEKVQQQFIEPLRKCTYYQLLIANPKYIGDTNIYDALNIRCNRYNELEQMMELETLNKKIELIGDVKDKMKIYDKDGNEVPLISTRLLLDKYLPLTKAEKELNEKYIKEEQENIKKAIQNQTYSGENQGY
ncbi:capsid assembly protein [Chryseobacterium phage MA9V-2]|nr:capsid assembly protein [Chryseobacterium phage MA9V-2]